MKTIERRLAALERASRPQGAADTGARQRLRGKIETIAARIGTAHESDLPAIRAALAAHPIIGRVLQ